MYLSIINLDSPGQFLRLLLWIFLPIGILYLLISAWLRYRRGEKEAGGLRLAVEGFGGDAGGEKGYGGRVGGDDGFGRHAGGEEGYSVGYTADAAGAVDEVTEEEAGKETIYRGILWMKEKYEQYRDQADKRYELLREELGRSEKRYQDLLLSIEQNKNIALGVVGPSRQVALPGEMSAGEGEILAEPGTAVAPAVAMGRGLSVVEELEEQLRIERLKVEELVVKLQTNSRLLLKIYKELDKSIDVSEE